jgi:hypothetical protein
MVKRHENFYSPEFKIKVFYHWFNSGQPAFDKFYSTLPKQLKYDGVSGRNLGLVACRNMIDNFRAEAYHLEKEAWKQLQDQIVSDRVEMIKRHLPELMEIQKKSLQVLREEDAISPRIAADLYFKAMEQEQKYRNLNLDEYERVSNMDNSELQAYIQRLADDGVLLDDGLPEDDGIDGDLDDEISDGEREAERVFEPTLERSEDQGN